jgi:DNA-binding transcriptional ArsR family regulator
LDALRMAGLVYIDLEGEGKRYKARQEAIDSTFTSLESYLDKK